MSQEKKRELRVEYVPLDDLKDWEKNPKAHDLTALHNSVRRFGFVAPIIVNEANGKLLAGHGRVKTLREEQMLGGDPPEGVVVKGGRWTVPVVRGVSLDDKQHAAYGVADNQLTMLGGWDDQMLADVLSELRESGELAATGFQDADVDDLLKSLEKVDEPGVSGMEIQPFEHYDYIAFVFKDYRDWMVAQQMFGLRDVQIPFKRGKVGLGRVLDGKRLVELAKRGLEQESAERGHDAPGGA